MGVSLDFDQGTQFSSSLFKSLCNKFGIRFSNTLDTIMSKNLLSLIPAIIIFRFSFRNLIFKKIKKNFDLSKNFH